MTEPSATPGPTKAAKSSDLPDSIERSIEIDATAARVYELAALPGSRTMTLRP